MPEKRQRQLCKIRVVCYSLIYVNVKQEFVGTEI